MIEWQSFKTVSDLSDWLSQQYDPDEVLEQIKERPEGLAPWIILGILDGEPAFGLPLDLATKVFDLDDDDAVSPYDLFYPAVESLFEGFTGIKVTESGETFLDFDDDSRISEAEGTWLIAENNTHWEWEAESGPDGLLITFNLTDESEVTD